MAERGLPHQDHRDRRQNFGANYLQIFRIQYPKSSGSGDPAGKSQEGPPGQLRPFILPVVDLGNSEKAVSGQQ